MSVVSSERIHPISVSGNLADGNVYLTSGVQPPTDTGSFLDQLRIHSIYQSYASGGSVYHINIQENMPPDKKSSFIRNMFGNWTIRYVSLTPILSICQSCGNKKVGKMLRCNKCNSDDITVWSRPVGYLRPAVRGGLSEDLKKHNHRYWMNGRLEEFLRRIVFTSEDLDLNDSYDV